MNNIIEKYLENSASEEERIKLLKWLREENHFAEFRKMKNIWKKSLPLKITDHKTEEGLIKFQSFILNDQFTRSRKLFRIKKWYKYSAVAMLLILIGVGVFYSSNQFKEPLTTTVFADKGHIASIILPDSSKVWLNSGSNLTYANNFGETKRNLTINGQAYFEVVKNKNLPFIVRSRNVNVKVLGTRFTVDAYDKSDISSVILEEGKVELSIPKHPKYKLIMKPGEKLEYDVGKKKVKKIKVKAEKYSSWRNGVLNFYNSPLSEVVRKLENRFNYGFYLDESLKDIKVTFTINQEELPKVLEMLKTITPINIASKEDSILIRSY